MKNKKGQGVIEMILFSFALIISINLSMILFWILANKLWTEHSLYQGLICRAEKKPMIVCKQQILKNMKKLNKIGSFKELKLTNFQNEWKGSIEWEFFKKVILIKSHLNLKNL